MAASHFDPSSYPSLSKEASSIIREVTAFAQGYFQDPKFDASHDWNHVMRVVNNAIHILDEEQPKTSINKQESSIDPFVVIVGALLHDVDDRKYVDADGSGSTVPITTQELRRLGMSHEETVGIQSLVDGVSYSSEVKDPERVKSLIREIPELAIVQDADRLDAIGAVGIARCFTFGGAKKRKSLEDSVEHFHEKLVKLEGMMKTSTGKRMAAERTRRVKDYLEWWDDETGTSM